MQPPRFAVVLLLLARLTLGLRPPVKKTCHVEHDSADCSHLSLTEVPSYLPKNITSLDMSHNRLVRLPVASLAPYRGILHLDVSHNSISRLTEDLCQTLPLLQTLNIVHNQVHLLKDGDMSQCVNLTRLYIGNNKLKLKGEPFSALQSLTFLDVSYNKLPSAKLGSQPQLPSLETINLSGNDISTLNPDDFSFLSRSLSLRVVNMSSLPLKSFTSGCFKPIASLHILIMDRCNLGTTHTSKLCSELSGTAISSLSLREVKLVTLTNTTFRGLENTNLTMLDLSKNGMGKIEQASFHWLSSLEVLVLEDNKLHHLTKDTFQGLGHLKKLNLRKALVKGSTSATPIIDNFSFQPLSALESLTLQHTTIREISEHTFTGLTSLSELEMDWSSCASLKSLTDQTFVSLAGSPLRKLNLTATAIGRIGPGAFSSLGNLTSLLLGYNFIRQKLTGKEFSGLGQVQVINLSNNRQTITLTSGSFVNVPSLRYLTLSRALNSTGDLDVSLFRQLSNLILLDLSNNNIANIKPGLFEGLGNLKVLRLQHNNLARVWKSANPGGPVLFLKGLHSLTTLDMDYTGLDEIPLEALRGLNNLRELSLSNNVLNSLKDSVFDGLTSLRVLRMQKNLITAVRPEVFKLPLSNLSLLLMQKNPFDCTCESMLWFVSWLNTTNTTVDDHLNDQYMCNTPLAYFNHTVRDFDPLSCQDMTPFEALYILSSTAVLATMLVALLVRFHGWRINFYWSVFVSRTLGSSDATVEEGREFEYDAYVIHAKKDYSWVERSLLPLEDENYKFCLDDRDLVPGEPQLRCIMDNMTRKSRKILFIVTESLLRDPWCIQFKSHHALHQVIETSRDSVVLVFLQDVHDYRLSQNLCLRRGMLRPRCVLHWPDHKERIPAFHQQLRIALGLTNRLHQNG